MIVLLFPHGRCCFCIQILAFTNKNCFKDPWVSVDIRLKVYILISLREVSRSATSSSYESYYLGTHQTVFLCDCMIYISCRKPHGQELCILTSIAVVPNFYFSHSAKYVVTSSRWF